MKSFLKIFGSILISVLNICVEAQELVTYKAENGDGIYRIFNKYMIGHKDCEKEFFLVNNDLTETHIIYRNFQYQLPIKIFNYNGKSIRSTLKKDDWDWALAISKYNDEMYKRGLKKGDYRKDHELWVPLRFLDCDNPINVGKKVLTAGNRTLHMPLFGKANSDIKIKNKALQGKVFYLVSGHGGPDPGAMAQTNENVLCEDEYAYDVMLRLARNLLAHGAEVQIIVQDPNDGIRDEAFLDCDKDERCGNEELPINQLKRLEQRADLINYHFIKNHEKGIKDQLALIIHVDSRPKTKRQDVFFYHLEGSEKGKYIADAIHEKFGEKYAKHRQNGQYEGSVSERDLYMLRSTYPPAVYIELGNLKNPKDQKRFILNSNREALANWIFEGISGLEMH